MKRPAAWSHGILIVMVGIVFAVLGLMQVLILPMGAMNWWLMILGVTAIVGGVLTSHRAAPKRDRSLPANEKRLPSARVLPPR